MHGPKLNSILVVDDNPTNLSVLSQALHSAGWQVRVAIDGESALSKAIQNPPALILLDVQMPGMDGFETCRHLQADPETRDIPIIFMTALADTASKVEGLSLGAVDYITKPFEQAEVLARVAVHLKLRQLMQTLEEQVAARTQDLSQALQTLKQSQVQLVQSEKMSTLGQMVAGVAHEVNNPVNFIFSNIQPARDYVFDLAKALRLYQQHCGYPTTELQEMAEDIDFALEDLPNLLNSMQVGAERIKALSVSLRNFSRVDSVKVAAQLHEGLESSLLILQHRLKGSASHPEILVVKNYGDLPPILCYPGQLNQVFMNLLANAIDALEEAGQISSEQIPTIAITTAALEDQRVEVRISDNGIGMTAELQQRLFEPMFTTKPVGKGTGLGLSISHQIVVERHQGTLYCQSAPGKGTEFVIQLPSSTL